MRVQFGFVWFLCLLIGMAQGCQDIDPEPKPLSRRQKRQVLIDSLSKFSALPTHIPEPADNPRTPEKVALGKLLFFDPILSGNKDVACATCHHPENGFAESLDISIGVNGKGFGSKRHFVQPNEIPFTKRNSQTVLNTAFNGIGNRGTYTPEEAPMFWDLRVKSLEKQALEPIKSLEEMRGMDYEADEILSVVINRLRRIPSYKRQFEEVFGSANAVTEENLGKAVAAYERSLVTNDSRFDQYMRGDQDAISLSEKEGFLEFKKAGCGSCHNGPMFSDYQVHVLGVAEHPQLGFFDLGTDSTYAFRTPTLRNLRFTFPYMHNGSIKSLKQVLEFYEDISFGKTRNPAISKEQLDPLVKEIRIEVKDMNQIISFLNTLNDNRFDKSIPESVPSGLPVGGNIDK